MAGDLGGKVIRGLVESKPPTVKGKGWMPRRWDIFLLFFNESNAFLNQNNYFKTINLSIKSIWKAVQTY